MTAVPPYLLYSLDDMMGKDVVITGRDGTQYTGILSACSPNMDFGLNFAYKITDKNRKNLLPKKSEIEEKMQFHFLDVVEIKTSISEEKPGTRAMGFATDKDYHATNDDMDEAEFEEWNAADEDEGVGGSIEDHENTNDLPEQRNRRNGPGWSVDEMFKVNEKLNVKSTFKEDLTQYTTVSVEGTEEDRRRAENIAREIEQNQTSKFYARLENDDVERDLDKETTEEEFEQIGPNGRRVNRNSGYNQQSRRGNAMGMNGQMNRRAEGFKSTPDRRNSGGNQGRHQMHQFNGNNMVKNGTNHYNSNNANRRQGSEEFDWQMSKGKNNNGSQNVIEGSINQKYHKQPSQDVRQRVEEKQAASRVTDLKNFKRDFPIVLNSEAKDGTTTPVPSTANAWNRGPPSSLVAKGSNGIPSDSSSPVSSVSQSSPSTSALNDSPPKAAVDKVSKECEKPSTSNVSEPADKEEQKIENEATKAPSETSDASSGTKTSFKFNINAPEFKPRAAAASSAPTSTPQPTTPTGQMQQVPPTSQYMQEQMNMGHPIHMHQGGHQPIPMQNAQMVPQVVWQQQAAPFQFQVPMVAQGAPIPRGAPAQGQVYGAATSTGQPAPNTSSGQQPNRRVIMPQPPPQQQWNQQGQIVPMNPPNMSYMNYPQHQYVAQIHSQPFGHVPTSQGQMMPNQNAGGGPNYPQPPQQQQPPPQQQQPPQGQPNQSRYPPQWYMMQGPQPPQRYPNQPPPPPPPSSQHEYQPNAAPSHPNSQPPTPGPNQQGQNVTSPAAQGGLQYGAESGSSGNLSGSGGSQSGGQRTASPQQHLQHPQHHHHQHHQMTMMAIPPPQQMQYMQVAQTQPQMHHQMSQPQPGPQSHPPHHYYPQQQMYYQSNIVYQQQQPHVPGQHPQMIASDHTMDPNMAPPYTDQYGNYINAGHQGMYQGGPMSRQNSIPQYQQQQQQSSSSQSNNGQTSQAQ